MDCLIYLDKFLLQKRIVESIGSSGAIQIEHKSRATRRWSNDDKKI